MRRYVFRLVLLSCAVLGLSAARGDDQQIAQQIMARLQAEKQAGTLKGFSIDLQVDEGTVWLSGRVASSEQQAKALDLARRVSGVKQVVDDLTIAAPAPKAVASRPGPAPTPAMVHMPPSTTPADQTPMAPPVHVAAGTQVPMIAAVQVNQPAPQEPSAPANQVAKSSSRKSASNNSVLNNVGKSLMTAVQGNHQEEPQPSNRLNSVQPASVSGDVAAAIGAGPVGSGVDPSANSSRRSALMAAQPIAAAPQMVAPADALQPLNPTHPQMTAMVPYMVPYYGAPQMQMPQTPLPIGATRPVNYAAMAGGPGYGGMPVGPGYGAGAGGPAYGPVPGGAPDGMAGAPAPMYMPGSGVGIAPARYDHPSMPGYAWPSYACYPNYAAVTYPKQYSPTAWPYIGPFYPYPQVPLGWRKVTLEWDDGWWMLDFKDRRSMYNH